MLQVSINISERDSRLGLRSQKWQGVRTQLYYGRAAAIDPPSAFDVSLPGYRPPVSGTCCRILDTNHA